MQNTKQYITEDEDGYNLCINVNEQCDNYTVESINMFIAKDADEGSGDLAVCIMLRISSASSHAS